MKPFVFFDLGGTLAYDSLREGRFLRHFLHAGVELREEAVSRAFHRADRHFMEHQPRLWLSNSPRLHQEHLAWVAAHLGVAGDLRPLLQDRSLAWSLHREVYPVLLWLRVKGYGCGLITNWNPGARRVIARLGLTPFLQVVVVSSEVGVAKPDPRIFQAALAEAGVDPGEAFYVGDDYRADILGAWSAGMEALLVDRHPEWSPRHWVCPGADSLWGVVHRLLPGDLARAGRTA